MAADSIIRDRISALLARGADNPLSEAEFNDLALATFAYQFEHNQPYQRYCERRAGTPATVDNWTAIPAVPTQAFKETALVAGDSTQAEAVFKTSGTTRGAERRGAHYILDLELYRQSLLAGFKAFVLPDRATMRMISLMPMADGATDSSLGYMISAVMREYGTPDNECVADYETGIDYARLNSVLSDVRVPVCLLGTSLAFLHWLERVDFDLPNSSRIMDTGGFKGEQRSVSADELRERYQKQLGLDAQHCVNEYGMTELCSQYYDSVLRDEQIREVRAKQGPPWLRARVVDPETLAPMPRGETGILQHFDLANLYSVSAVLTEDLAYEVADGFVLLGRAPGAMPRGCSIAMDILLSDVQQ